MSVVRFRLTGSQQASDAIVTELHGLDDIERIEEIADQMRSMRDDSSSAGLVDDAGLGVHDIEVECPHRTVQTIKDLVEAKAFDLGIVAEFVDRF